MAAFLLRPRQAYGVAKATWLLECADEIEPYDYIHIAESSDGSEQLKVESTSSEKRRYVNNVGEVSEVRWPD
jgi:hypothetical protein